MDLPVGLRDGDKWYKVQQQSVSSSVPQGLIQGIRTVPWMMDQHVQQVCEQCQTGGVSDTLQDRAAVQRDRPER